MKRMICSLLCLVMLSVPAWAASPSEEEETTFNTEITNNLRSGDIDVELKEYQLGDGDTRVDYENDKVVLPGQTVSKIAEVQNNAEPAWVRMKVAWAGDSNLDFLADETTGLKIDPAWVKYDDGYYYLKTPLEKGETKDFMTGFQIPADYGNEVAEDQFRIDLTLEAVQEAHFEPRWDDEGGNPWFGTVVELCEHHGYEDVAPISQNFSLDFTGGAQGFVRVGDDFFSNWDRLMPGDTETGAVEVKDSYGPVFLYFSTRNDVDADKEMLSAISLKITRKDGTVVFDSNLSDVLDSPVLLGKYDVGSMDTLTYTITVPTWLSNAYAMRNAKTTWVFTAVVDQDNAVLPYTGGPGLLPFALLGAGLAGAGLCLKKKGGEGNAR